MITWDGHHHAATGLHVDNEKVPELTEFATQGGFDDLKITSIALSMAF